MKANYHTHSTFCDGNDTPEQIVRNALEKGFSVLGFSGHSMYPFSSDWHIPSMQFGAYVDEIRRLQAKHQGQLEILLGFEVDYLPPLSFPRKNAYQAFKPDYIIGSTHFITTRDGWFTVDGPVEEVAYGIDTLFKGDGRQAVQAYFRLQREMLRECDFDIIGHIDVIRKRNEELHFFDEQESWYRTELEATARVASEAGVIVEINTGGIARGAINDVYPSADFLAMLCHHNVPVMINSDAHSAGDLDCAFSLASRCAMDAGYNEVVCLRHAGNHVERQFVSLRDFNC